MISINYQLGPKPSYHYTIMEDLSYFFFSTTGIFEKYSMHLKKIAAINLTAIL